MTPSITGVSHVALTVRDMQAGAEWYQRVFGWQVLRHLAAGEAGTPRVLLFDPTSFLVVALCQPDDGTGDRFDHRRTGLDHLAFRVADRAELDRWLTQLADHGVAPSPVHELDLGSFVSFEDPDGIQIELWVDATG